MADAVKSKESQNANGQLNGENGIMSYISNPDKKLNGLLLGEDDEDQNNMNAP